MSGASAIECQIRKDLGRLVYKEIVIKGTSKVNLDQKVCLNKKTRNVGVESL